MQNMQAHAPQMKEIQRKYKGDRQKLNEELMKFYKENNINPASSCLPLARAVPDLHRPLLHAARVREESAASGIDRSRGCTSCPSIAEQGELATGRATCCSPSTSLSQLASTYFMSGTMQQSQRILMMILPFVFIPFIIRFPAGLVLYWMTTNLWTVGQGLITRRLIPKVGGAGALRAETVVANPAQGSKPRRRRRPSGSRRRARSRSPAQPRGR